MLHTKKEQQKTVSPQLAYYYRTKEAAMKKKDELTLTQRRYFGKCEPREKEAGEAQPCRMNVMTLPKYVPEKHNGNAMVRSV